MHEIDRALKILSGRYPDEFMKLLFGDQKGVSLLGVEDTQLNIPEKRSDKIFHVKHNNKKAIFNLEFVLQPNRKELANFFVKTAMLVAHFKTLPVVTIIVYVEKGRYATFPAQFENQFLRFSNYFIFDRILLWDFKNQIESGELPHLAPLIPLFYNKPDIKVLEKDRELIYRVSEQQERADLIALAMMVALRKFKKEFIYDFFKEEYDMLKEADFIQEWKEEWIEEGREKGREEGREKGREEGREEGIAYGKYALLLHMIRQRFRTIDPVTEKHLHDLHAKDIDELSVNLFAMQSLDDLVRWLYEHNGNS